ncbi:LysR family transcriptional regulator [Enterococcus casseliflavus]|uniref:LysR family transcriptional regulator n=1 Tax=Enterococcus casseliflavus TaxID=37734 RepID=A0ABD6Z410_ENTCA|nr:LysR family transcriptional regulator [Enterococcus casseliflavus]MBE9880886.1 LysR family transcriptional regulator [Enterococcus casseliflavus]MCD5161392.1 LysR family transcriptional regulator [Enterococcus casseliflavus]MDT2962432.1 LysR family transcriptional regulator [Enterococcus casseliflavus]QGN29578.1 LysR family transcriptional regulator [Enterococcus casseliflavus]
MQFQQLIYFNEIIKAKSMNRAANNLYLSQPSLSKSMQLLEEEIGTKLFIRTNKGVILTENGEKLAQYSKTILAQLEMIKKIPQEKSRKVLNIASYPLITVEKVIADFYNVYDFHPLVINFEQCRLNDVIEKVEKSDAEIGIIMYNEAQSREIKNILRHKHLLYTEWMTDTWYVNLGKKNPLYHSKMISMEELRSFPVIRKPDDYYSSLSFYLEIDGIRLAELDKVIYTNDNSSIITMLQKTDVFRFGPSISKNEFNQYGIKTIPIKNCQVFIRIGWIKRKKEILSNESQSFIEFFKREICEKNSENLLL